MVFLSSMKTRPRITVISLIASLFFLSGTLPSKSQVLTNTTPPQPSVAPATPTINPLTGPSFPCPQPEDPLAQLVCSIPELALLDMQFVQSYEALYQQAGVAGDSQLRSTDIQFNTDVRAKCGIGLSQVSNPSPTPPPPAPPGSGQCVISAYQQQISLWKSVLTGAAAEEASRPIQDQVAIQARLQALGFLSPQEKIDGVFGSSTRVAILKWQASDNLPQTGLVGNNDAKILLKGISNNTASTVSTANSEQLPLSSPLTIQNIPSSPSVSMFSNPEGIRYANLNETTWATKSNYNEMTDKKDISVVSYQNNNSGVYAQITGACQNKVISFYALITDENGNPNITLSNENLRPNTVLGRIRINSNPEEHYLFNLTQFNNETQIAQLSLGGGHVDEENSMYFGTPTDIVHSGDTEDARSTWRILAELDTDHGTILIKIPVYDFQIKGLIDHCLDLASESLNVSVQKGGYIGVNVQNISSQIALALGLPTVNPTDDGALVAEVIKDEPADNSGIKQGDVITEVNNRKINNTTDLANVISSIAPKQSISITYLRNGTLDTTAVITGPRPSNSNSNILDDNDQSSQ